MRRIVTAQKIREKRTKRKSFQIFGLKLKYWFFLGVCSLGSIFYGILWVSGLWGSWIESLESYYVSSTARMGFVIEDVLLEGRNRVLKEDVLKVLDIQWGASILKFDPWVAKSKLETLPWIRASLVERRLPNLIYVRLSERHPIARWQHRQKIDLIDDQGDVIPLKKNEILREFSDLPLFVGEGAEEKGPHFLKILKEFPEIEKQITASSLVRGRRWNIYLNQKIEVRLPEDHIEEALKTLNHLEKSGFLTARKIKILDLRFLPQIIVRVEEDIILKKSLPMVSKKGKDI